MDCFVALAPVRKRVAFVAGNDGGVWRAQAFLILRSGFFGRVSKDAASAGVAHPSRRLLRKLLRMRLLTCLLRKLLRMR
jgi:hypothetical protein